jgi:hypothetical protein
MLDANNGVYGIGFHNLNSISSVNINGVFRVCGHYYAYGASFYVVNNSHIDIDGAFTINADTGYVYGVFFGNNITTNSGVRIDGVFTISCANGSTTNGVYFNGNISNSGISVDGVFALKIPNSDSTTLGINFYITPQPNANYDATLLSQFFSYKIDSGNLKTIFSSALYDWNGLPVNSAGSTLADNSLAITKVGATDSRY